MGDTIILDVKDFVDIEYITRTAVQTRKLGEKIALRLEPGDVLALCGQLGAGKTCLTQGISKALGVDKSVPVTSPTFTIVNEYQGKVNIYHIDFYRIQTDAEFYLSGLEEFFADDAITVVEWADRHPEIIPDNAVWVSIEIGEGNHRKIKLRYRKDKNEKKFCF